MVEVGHERSGSRGHGGGGTRAAALELTWWGWKMSSWARIDMVREETGDQACEDMVEVGHERWTRIDMVRVGHEQSGLN